MKLRQIYELAVELGKKYDVRGDYLYRILEAKEKEYEKLAEDEKEFYDKENLVNPFSDTRILVGSGEEEVETILCGIDMEIGEIILADRLREKGHKIDLVMAHHPEGIAYAALHDVMHLQEDMLARFGVPINVAEGVMAGRIAEVERNIMPANHQRAVDAARLLDLPFMCVHSPADNLVNNYLDELFNTRKPDTLGDIMDILLEIPEYKKARELKAGPKIIVGDKKRRCGRIFVKMTGGTSGAVEAYSKLAQAGVGTIICMHMPDKHRQAAKENHINVVIAGHMASDSLGMNLFLDELEKAGINIIPCSGLIRVKRFADSDGN
ncbi:Putative GTP cyclohydrolase 1 type 2, NIF3 family [Thermosyntropha lipolytica DSM 11003]|uniref:Putative GTP cyclohydrolase 1 type 2, NIF3 family n=1 Tax=Thermosyntropha lipolytica DSM 11003 TaxID=1123382 RepID=A0A1M5K7M9_9FIRM|nr:NGG1p interacting factor NIF3 [Thermosyntropha lipolytica]SHG48610.1 Putative GTP cyclohydrolase 1 type 2, NIF3 family [Thermosyntropha lipolytica DSM 11003]